MSQGGLVMRQRRKEPKDSTNIENGEHYPKREEENASFHGGSAEEVKYDGENGAHGDEWQKTNAKVRFRESSLCKQEGKVMIKLGV